MHKCDVRYIVVDQVLGGCNAAEEADGVADGVRDSEYLSNTKPFVCQSSVALWTSVPIPYIGKRHVDNILCAHTISGRGPNDLCCC